MFELPRYVIKAGQVIVEQGEIRDPVHGKTLHVAPDYDRGVEADIAAVVREVLLDPLSQLPGDRRLPARARNGGLRVSGDGRRMWRSSADRRRGFI